MPERHGGEDRPASAHEEARAFSEERESLWRITLGPVIWAAHFLICYGAVSVYCFRLRETLGMAGLRLGLVAMTVAMLAAIGLIGWRAFRRWDVYGTGEFSNPEGSAEDRHQFLGHAGFLLALISFIGVIYDALPLLLIGTCR